MDSEDDPLLQDVWLEEEQEEEEDAFKMLKHWDKLAALRKTSKGTKRKSDFQ